MSGMQDVFQQQLTTEEQHLLLQLLPNVDQQALSAGHNPLASMHLKAAAANYLQASQQIVSLDRRALHLLCFGSLDCGSIVCIVKLRCAQRPG